MLILYVLHAVLQNIVVFSPGIRRKERAAAPAADKAAPFSFQIRASAARTSHTLTFEICTPEKV